MKKRMIGLLILSLLMFSACTGSHHAVTHTPATAQHNYQKKVTVKHTNKKRIQKTKKQKTKEKVAKKDEIQEKLNKQQNESKEKATIAKQQQEEKQAEVNQKTAEAKTLVIQAEITPIRENYNAAQAAVKAIPNSNQELSTRLAAIERIINTNEATEKAKIEREKQQENATSTAQQATQAVNSTNDVNTGNQQSIIGNSKTKIYHMPGQAGYHMNGNNVVIFHSEQEAQAAGYRKSLR
ncbi:Ada metal-binding domain-containing protein [Melissococcus plutonius]|uniref:sunset domain-containing protein n=2 Tax=Melissococcus plutonius TaxID=33970 RepID=UPI0021E53559|nr:Ada metal-binding domain-containing protein [Melissococcus plutonius]MCV2498255.1 hypothetical protein [Melissococcus plutonius]MCV2501674.1 hypothetical protein [Melissococcus plutonius]MCV2504634.1 hypothetical protein [Melissococcus plutonius]MCV2506870.1 hypothetical protein [Melissococcus plutonius]MCV2519640.1 hypothetical protein [Melissococcus plutonius]